MYADTDFFLALFHEDDRLKKAAEKILAAHAGKLRTSVFALQELMLVCYRNGVDPLPLLGQIAWLAKVEENVSQTSLLLAAHLVSRQKASPFDAMHAVACGKDTIVSSDKVFDRLGLKRLPLEAEPFQALILAAGRGVRLKPLTNAVPKAMVPLNGRPLLEHLLERLKAAGCKQALIVVGYRKEAITERLGRAFQDVKLDYVQQAEQLGTGHAVLQAEGRLREDFLCVNADVIVEPKAYKDAWEKRGFEVVIAAHESKEPWKYGCLKVSGDRVLDVVEKPPRGKEPGSLVGLGVYRLTPRIFDVLKKVGKSGRGEYEITDAFRLLAKEGKAGFVRYDELHLDIGSPEGLKRAAEALKKK